MTPAGDVTQAQPVTVTGGTRLLALNVANPPAERATALLEWLWHQEDEVLVLSEVGGSAGSALMLKVCRAAGYDVVRTVGRGLGVALIGRGVTLDPLPVPSPVVERIVRARVGGLDVAGVYGAASDPVRYTSRTQRQRKRDWLVAFEGWLGEWVGPSSVVIGDLNLVDPQHDSRLPHVLAQETETYHALTERHGLVDAYRIAHPQAIEPSWLDHSGAGCRYDHAFVAPALTGRADLIHAPRELGLSDHSAVRLWVEGAAEKLVTDRS